MQFPRSSGILLHPTSLPGRFGIGELGDEAFRFIEFLHDAGQRIWQVLPLGPTGYGDSPYQLFSAFAGNPLLISLDKLVECGWLTAEDTADPPDFPCGRVDFGWVIHWKLPLLRRAFENFRPDAAYNRFLDENAPWLEDFALFMALKEAHHGRVWTEWAPSEAMRKPAVLDRRRKELEREIERVKVWQHFFFSQWRHVKGACEERGIRIMGDIPIYVAHDSADVWANPELFRLDERGRPEYVAGVPPDYFSATGQLWGNPIYRWDTIAKSGYRWWVDRLRAALQVVDMVRLDHFRGFEAYWQVPATEKTAMHGEWIKGPGSALFEALEKAVGELPIVAENLGVITPEVEAMRHRFGFPGMAVLQFAFGKDPQAPTFRPHNYPRDVVAYTGTHDNDTTFGWWTSRGEGDSTRTREDIEQERVFTKKYLATDGSEMNWAFIRALMASVAATAIIPLQDVLGLGSEARMNLPASERGNWGWRYREEDLTPDLGARLRELATLYDR